MYSRERHSFRFLPEMPTDEPHRDDDVTPRSLHSTSSRPVHCNQGRIKLKYWFFIIKKKKRNWWRNPFILLGFILFPVVKFSEY
jgi:hypothetical protein